MLVDETQMCFPPAQILRCVELAIADFDSCSLGFPDWLLGCSKKHSELQEVPRHKARRRAIASLQSLCVVLVVSCWFPGWLGM